MRSRIAVAALFVFAAVPLGARAYSISASRGEALVNEAAEGFSCPNCAPVQMRRLAASKGRGSWYVYNLPVNVINEYDVTCEPSAQRVICSADEGVVSTPIATYFATYQGLWIQNGRKEAFQTVTSINFPSAANGGPLNLQGMHIDDGYINAYDTLQISALEQAVISSLNNPGTYAGFYAGLVQLLGAIDIPPIKLDKLQATVTVVFHDGSKRTYQHNKVTGTFAPLDNSAFDSSGNLIPEKPPFNGTGYYGDPAHVYNLPNILTILNARDPTWADEICLQEVWKASPMGGGGTLTCVKSR